jgi:aryl-alcohol dehydrogenase-like predicted oxidoreductase
MNDGTPVQIRRFLGAESIKKECEESLERLGIEVIDLYQCHQPDPTTPVEESWGAMLELQKEGKVRAIGVSNFTVEMTEKCLSRGPVASDQPLYNALERDIEKDILPFCIENDIGVLAYSPMTQGLMTGKVTMEREFPEGDVRNYKPWFKPENRKRVLEMLKKIQPIADGHKATLAQVTINWVISQKGLTAALVGARNEKQVEENARAADFRLTEDELAAIRNAVEELGGPIT